MIVGPWLATWLPARIGSVNTVGCVAPLTTRAAAEGRTPSSVTV